MIKNGNDFANNARIRTQVCIVGSGPAGITAAWHLKKAGLNVILIEGSRDYRSNWQASWPDKVLLYNGVADGLFEHNEPDFLISPFDGQRGPGWERERVFGGTSAHWAGQCRPLDAVTFRQRPGFPKWPIDREDLDPWYTKAAAFLGIDSNFTAEHWAKILGADVPHFDGFDTEMYQFPGGNSLNFAERTFDGITIGETEALVILNASLLDIEYNGGSVVGLRVATMNGDRKSPKPEKHFLIQADAYVLACGAVANARQLLLSNVGNEHDQVGRYFMCHPISGGITFTKDFLTPLQNKLMSGGGWSSPDGSSVTGRFSPNAYQQTTLGIGSCWFSAKPQNGISGYYYEVAPDPNSQVRLAETRDPVFGQQQTRITWQLSGRDESTYTQTTRLFKEAVTKLGGEVRFAPWETIKRELFVNGHHIGTTRMSAEPKDGVVDANLKVHSLDNLYVAGSSVFASAGVSNPTFTIVTLSIRLAAHLRARLGKQPA